MKELKAVLSVYQGQVSYFIKQGLVGVGPSDSPIGWEIGIANSAWLLLLLLVKLSWHYSSIQILIVRSSSSLNENMILSVVYFFAPCLVYARIYFPISRSKRFCFLFNPSLRTCNRRCRRGPLLRFMEPEFMCYSWIFKAHIFCSFSAHELARFSNIQGFR